MRTIKKGTIVTCFVCHTAVYRMAKDIKSGDSIEASQFADNGFGAPKNGDRTDCPNCGYDLYPSLLELM